MSIKSIFGFLQTRTEYAKIEIPKHGFPFLVVCSLLRLSYKFFRLFDITLCESLEG